MEKTGVDSQEIAQTLKDQGYLKKAYFEKCFILFSTPTLNHRTAIGVTKVHRGSRDEVTWFLLMLRNHLHHTCTMRKLTDGNVTNGPEVGARVLPDVKSPGLRALASGQSYFLLEHLQDLDKSIRWKTFRKYSFGVL